MARQTEIAKFSSVKYNKETGDVFITFKVFDERYKDFVMRWAAREDGRLIIRGETLSVVEAEEDNDAVV